MNAKPNSLFSIFERREGSRVAYYWTGSKRPDEHWDEHWSLNFPDGDKFYEPYLRGYLGVGQLRRILLKHLPRTGLILEGGCGMAQYVVALRARGYDCCGVDFAEKTVEAVLSRFPDLPVSKGNILDLDMDAESLDAYISLGIVEHFQEGPQKAISEAFRVLKKNGKLLISVPHAFRWRQMAVAPESTPLPDQASFYQYAFHQDEFRTFLHEAGFSIQSEYGIESHYAFRVQYPWFRKLVKQIPRLRHLDLLLDPTPLGRNLGRMHMYVAVKK